MICSTFYTFLDIRRRSDNERTPFLIVQNYRIERNFIFLFSLSFYLFFLKLLNNHNFNIQGQFNVKIKIV